TICQRSCGPGCFTTTIGNRCMTLRPAYAWNYYRRVRYVAAQATRFARVVVPSEYVRGRFVQVGFPESKVAVIPYFCPLELPPEPRIPPAEPTILYIGRLSPNKGYGHFVEALGRLPARVQGIMVGNFGPAVTAEVQHLADRWNCASRLSLRPWASRAEMQA